MTFDIEINMLSQACKKKMNVMEMPSREKSRVFGYSKLNTFKGVEFIFQILLGKQSEGDLVEFKLTGQEPKKLNLKEIINFIKKEKLKN